MYYEQPTLDLGLTQVAGWGQISVIDMDSDTGIALRGGHGSH